MIEYHKIYNLWERDPQTKYKTLIEGKWAKDEFEYLKDLHWWFDEKIDGMNIRVMWDGETVRFGGKTDNAQIPATLIEVLQKKFYAGAMKEVFKGPVTIYGEGYGAKIQKGGGNYKSDGVDFVAFDILAGDTWFHRPGVQKLCEQLEVAVLYPLGGGTLEQAIAAVKHGVKSSFGDFEAEGLVVRPGIELKDQRGRRIIGKIKGKDFKNVAD